MNIEDRTKLLQLLGETVQDVIRGGWMRQVDFREQDFSIRWHTDGTGTVETPDHRVLLRFQVEVTCSAVEPPPIARHRPWSQIPAGWLVLHPKKDEWLKVLATKLVQGKQRVRLEFPDGQLATFPYPPDTVVTCRPGEPSETDTALEVLGGDAHILEDEL